MTHFLFADDNIIKPAKKSTGKSTIYFYLHLTRDKLKNKRNKLQSVPTNYY